MKIIESYYNPEAGLRADVFVTNGCLRVRLVDTDCNEVLPSIRAFPMQLEEKAHEYARKCVSWC